jgi:hypothetical protein
MIGAPLVTTINTCFILTEAFPEVKLTVPPHLKAKPSNSNVPVVGSRKRKARKLLQANHFLFLLLNTVCMSEKKQIQILACLV